MAPLTSFFFEGAVDMGNGNDDDGNEGNNNDNYNNNDNDNNNDNNDAVIMRFDLTDLPILTSFVGITIEGGDLHFVEVVAFGGVLFFVVLALVGCLFWFGFGQFFLIGKKIKKKIRALRHLLNLI